MRKVFIIIFVLFSTFSVFGQTEHSIKIGDYEFQEGYLSINSSKDTTIVLTGRASTIRRHVLKDGRIVLNTYLTYILETDEAKELLLSKKEQIREKYGFVITKCQRYGHYIELTIEYPELVPIYEAQQRAERAAKKKAMEARLNSLREL